MEDHETGGAAIALPIALPAMAPAAGSGAIALGGDGADNKADQ